jgi:hypothetical protein
VSRRGAALLALLCGVGAAAWARSASADEAAASVPAADALWVAPPVAAPIERAPLLADALAGTAITSIVLGGVMLGIGVPVWATGTSGERRCGALAGCFESNGVDDDALAAGSALTGMGLGFAATGGITIAALVAAPGSHLDARRSDPLAVTGLMLTSLSFGSLLGGFAYGGAHAALGDAEPFEFGLPLFITSGLAAAVGLPMVVAGTPHLSAEERAQHVEALVPTTVRVGPGRAAATWSF